MIPIRIRPTKATTTIAMSCVDYINKFRPNFHDKKLIEFFIFGKTTVGNDIYLEIRSMRVNEFIMLLENHKIRWRHITESYK